MGIASPVRRADRQPPAPANAPAGDEPSRDHALALHRFLGGVQVFGGITLITAYALGAQSLPVRGAASILIAIGALQVFVGVSWLVRTRTLRAVIVRRPGLFVLATLVPALAVMMLGGSNRDALYVTSAMCWLIASGYALPGLRWLAVSVAAIVAVGAVWIAVQGSGGGYFDDGDYVTALVGLAAAVVPGLWLGLTTGLTFSTLNRWYLVELHERGLVRRLRTQLQAVDAQAARLAALLPSGASSTELGALRSRLAQGVGLSDATASTSLGELLEEIALEHASLPTAIPLDLEVEPRSASSILTPTAADAVVAVIRRQLLNVARHAPDAKVIRLMASTTAGTMWIRIEDDGGGGLPFRAGVGTAWSTRQLDRVGGTSRYYAGDAGVGFEIAVPVVARPEISDVPGLSIGGSLDRFGDGMLGALRWAGYSVDSLGAYVARDEIGALWLAMPIGSLVIELVVRGGVPGLRLPERWRPVIASAIAVALTAIYAFPANSPEVLIPSTTSVVILAHLVLSRQFNWWIVAEIARAAVALPLVLRHGSAAISVVVIYPFGFSFVALALLRFMDRARALEHTASDAVGRAALASAAVRGLSLRHDAVDVILRSTPTDDALDEAVAGLERSLGELGQLASGSLDPREVMRIGVQTALVQPVVVRRADVTPPRASSAPVATIAGAVDWITLIELAALAADERATCAPPGLLGRRRLRTIVMDWAVVDDRRELQLTLTAEPALRAPDERALRRLQAVADAVGVTVASTPSSLTLTYVRE
jgi:hypothetical protein